eukprot:3107229-Pyramimonas_sp.AAC.1
MCIRDSAGPVGRPQCPGHVSLRIRSPHANKMGSVGRAGTGMHRSRAFRNNPVAYLSTAAPPDTSSISEMRSLISPGPISPFAWRRFTVERLSKILLASFPFGPLLAGFPGRAPLAK